MDSKKLKTILVVVIIAAVILALVSSFFGDRIRDFMNGFITGLSVTVIAAALIAFWFRKSKK